MTDCLEIPHSRRPSFPNQKTINSTQQSFKSAKSLRTHTSEKKLNRSSSLVKSTNNSIYVDVAYNQQIKKVRKLSTSSQSSTQSLSESFQQMEKKMKKYKQESPELIDQKYMISGYVQLSKDYKNLFFQLEAFMQTLKGVLKYGSVEIEEDKIKEVNNYFQKHYFVIRTKVQDYYKIKESLYRLIRMKITEPYYKRVQRKIQIIEKTNTIFDLFRVYIEAFDFIENKAYKQFKDDIDQVVAFNKQPNRNQIGQYFNYGIKEIQEQINQTKDIKEGLVLSTIFEYKIKQIQIWADLILGILSFRYDFNVKYQMNNLEQSKKIIKSKKIYEQLIDQQEKVEDFKNNNRGMNKLYFKELEEQIEDLEQIKDQIIQWNLKLRKDQHYKRILSLVKFNIQLKKSLPVLNKMLQIKNPMEFQNKYKIKGTELCIQIQSTYEELKDTLKYYKKSREIQIDEYIQKQYNKIIIRYNQFLNIQEELSI